jgi:hypothetical protein
VKTKLQTKAMAKELFISPWFKKSLKYAYSLHPDNIFILSSKYGLLELDDEIDTYDVSLKEKSSGEKKKWADNVLMDLKRKSDIDKDNFKILAGETYCHYLVKNIKIYEIPMRGLNRGEQSFTTGIAGGLRKPP